MAILQAIVSRAQTRAAHISFNYLILPRLRIANPSTQWRGHLSMESAKTVDRAQEQLATFLLRDIHCSRYLQFEAARQGRGCGLCQTVKDET